MRPERVPDGSAGEGRAPSSGEPILCIEDLSIDYVTERGRLAAVKNLNIQIGRGEVFGLAGESGSGKSTAAMGALRLLPPPAVITRGRVRFGGQDVLAMTETELSRFRWREIAVVFQSAMNALNPVLTVGAQITDVILTHEQVSRRSALERAGELLTLVGLETAHLRSYPHQLSGGMRQRVVIAIALSLRPKLLFMDEPTTALDVVVQKEILQRLAELKEELGFSILFITHDLSLMLEFCDTIGILYAGRLVEVAPASALLSRAAHPYTQGLLHSFPHLTGDRHRMTGIEGTPPNMLAIPSGCAFHPRCSAAVAACTTSVPELIRLAPGHLGACHLAHPYESATSRGGSTEAQESPDMAGTTTAAPSVNATEMPLGDRETAPDLFLSLGGAPHPNSEAETLGPPRVRAIKQEEDEATHVPPEVADDDADKGDLP